MVTPTDHREPRLVAPCRQDRFAPNFEAQDPVSIVVCFDPMCARVRREPFLHCDGLAYMKIGARLRNPCSSDKSCDRRVLLLLGPKRCRQDAPGAEILPRIDQHWPIRATEPDSGKLRPRPALRHLRPTIGQVGQQKCTLWPDIGQCDKYFTNFHPSWSDFANFGANLAQVWPTSDNFGRTLQKSGQHRPTCWAKYAPIWAESQLLEQRFDNFSGPPQ